MLRDATIADAEAIARIQRQSVEAMDSTMAAPATREDIVEQLRAMGPREVWLVVEVPEGVVGWGVVKKYSPRPGYDLCCETSIFLDRSLVGRGLGRPLQQELLKRAEALGYHHVVAKIWAANAGSIRFHERFGYEMVGVQREIGRVGDKWRDVAIMQKIFTEKPGLAPVRD
ncbi:MAG: N-acetyltransferase [Candidatus Eremiobacteraeota bacterium]|nr:N-acetyltransferase [Candidatus Eremiobacteraeota bacterium]MCW5868060.1 N-acetyltransferase [Candidatus Eremiobacteraeota bacterium]